MDKVTGNKESRRPRTGEDISAIARFYRWEDPEVQFAKDMELCEELITES